MVGKERRAKRPNTLMDKHNWGRVHVDRREATHNGFSFNLLYSKSGMQLEDQLADFFQGLSSGDLGDLSPSQLNQLDKL